MCAGDRRPGYCPHAVRGTPVNEVNRARCGGTRCAITDSAMSGLVPTRYLSDRPVATADAARPRSTRARCAVGSASAGASDYYLGPRGGCYAYPRSDRTGYVDRSYYH
jgi:hypothetical protein